MKAKPVRKTPQQLLMETQGLLHKVTATLISQGQEGAAAHVVEAIRCLKGARQALEQQPAPEASP